MKSGVYNIYFHDYMKILIFATIIQAKALVQLKKIKKNCVTGVLNCSSPSTFFDSSNTGMCLQFSVCITSSH
ncbi:hypothetical protein LOK49_LG10G00857 [Camellia lanceoleosa]|uniref:Uncharacterized protein n=1 Tax=Camellia lanceoleosa TaxID=1840588 RepID=A0ACC0GAV2_9ERIC|nr:hypothetical protein LOK49_LG10G00857 [Camellia lanceoleosa]